MAGWLIIIGFSAVQGAFVFGAALAALSGLRTFHWAAKIAAMTVSYMGWTAAAVAVYAALGGSGGFMEGGGMLLFFFFTALIGSAPYLLVWLLAGPKRSKRDAAQEFS